jgi:Holliday junction resolvase
MAQRESKLSRKIIKELELRGIFAFKVHGGPMMMAGLPDIIVCMEGRFIGLETKMPDGGDPSPIQRFIHEKIRKSGGEVYVPRSVDEALA